MRILHFSLAYGYWGNLDPKCLDDEKGGQVGGGETALLHACFELASLGHDVTCAFRCKPGKYRGVTFRPVAEALQLAYGQDWDAIVSWDNAEPLLPMRGEGLKLLCSNQMNMISPLARGDTEITFVSPSRTHAHLMQSAYGVQKLAAIPNAVDPSWFSCAAPRDPCKVMYASSPDRGLHHLLRLWPRIHRAEPRAKLHVYYELDRWFALVESLSKYGDPQMKAMAAELAAIKASKPAGVVFEGAKHPRQVARDMCGASVLAYPCDTISFTEGFGTTVLQAYAAGMRPIVTDCDAFAELYGEGGPIELVGGDGTPNPLISRSRIDEDFADRVIQALDRAASYAPIYAGWGFRDIQGQRALAHRYSWHMVGRLWDALLRGDRVFWPEVEAKAA